MARSLRHLFQQRPPAAATEIVWDWPEAVPPASEPHREHLDIQIADDVGLIARGNPTAIVSIINRRYLSYDLQKLSLYALATILIVVASVIIGFGHQNTVSFIMSAVLVVIAAGAFGMNVRLKVPGGLTLAVRPASDAETTVDRVSEGVEVAGDAVETAGKAASPKSGREVTPPGSETA